MRATPTNRTTIPFLVILALAIPVGHGQGQEKSGPTNTKASTQSRAEIRIRIVCTKRGKEVPRRGSKPTVKGEARPYRLVGRKIRWEIGKERADSLPALSRILRRYTLPSMRIDDPKNPGKKRLRPVLFEPGPGVCYAEIIELIDVVADLAFVHISLDTLREVIMIPMSFEVIGSAKNPLFPRGVFCEPHDPDEDEWMPKIVVRQDGSYATLSPGKKAVGVASDFAAVRKQIDRWRAEATRRKLTEIRTLRGKERDAVTEYLAIMPDKWTPCEQVVRLMDECRRGSVAFWKFNLAVSDYDLEADPRRR